MLHAAAATTVDVGAPNAQASSLPVVSAESTPAEWTRYVAVRHDATAYHDWRWREVFDRAFGHESIYLAARSGGRIVGVLPLVLIDSRLFGRGLYSLPFVNYGGVLADDDAAARALVEEAAAVATRRRCRHVELRHVEQRFPALPVRRHKVTMLLDLKQPDAMWAAFDRKVRNQVRKAEKSGLTYHRGGAELLPEFYSVFARNMRDLGTPVYGRHVFEEILRALPEESAIHVVRSGEAPAAAGLTLRTRSWAEIPWASSIRDFNPSCPNHLLYWNILHWAASEGCARFDFGRSTPGEGTFKFKEQWGATAVPLHWEYWLPGGAPLPDIGPKNPKFKLAISIWTRLPLWVANTLGPSIVRSIP